MSVEMLSSPNTPPSIRMKKKTTAALQSMPSVRR